MTPTITDLTVLDTADLSGPDQPRDIAELSIILEDRIHAALMPQALRVYVPDIEASTTLSVRDEHVLGPSYFVEPEARALSARAKELNTKMISLANEVKKTQAGIQTALSQALASLTVLRSYMNSPNSRWMRMMDRFLDLSKIDSSQTRGILIEYANHAGVCLAPVAEDDLTGNITSIRLVSNLSGTGLPGDNMEIVALQDTPSALAPSQGSQAALSIAQQTIGGSGGNGQEPTVTFATSSDQHNHLASLLIDDDSAFFDWEKLYVPPRQVCAMHGTAYVHDSHGGTMVDVQAVTKNFGWKADLTREDGAVETNVPLVAFLQNPPIPGRDGPDSTLKLTVQLDLGSASPMNQLEVSVRQVNGVWPEIQGVEVSSDNSHWYALKCQGNATSWKGPSPSLLSPINVPTGDLVLAARGSSVIGLSVWEVPSFSGAESTSDNGGFPLVRYINVSFSQPDSYACPKGIGHPFYIKVSEEIKSSSSWFGLSHSHSDNVTSQRLPNPNQIVNVVPGVISKTESRPGQAIGAFLGTVADLTVSGGISRAAGTGLGAVLGAAGVNFAAIGSAIGGLWGKKTDEKKILQAGEYTDVFQGYRQVISVRRLRPMARMFSVGTTGQLVSEDYTFGQTFTAVKLFVDEMIPDGTSVGYELSFDHGTSWTVITPQNISVPDAPYVASPSTILKLDSPKTTVTLRASLNTTKAHSTPRLMGYNIEVLPFLG